MSSNRNYQLYTSSSIWLTLQLLILHRHTHTETHIDMDMHMHVSYIPYIPCKKAARQALKKVHNKICDRLLESFHRFWVLQFNFDIHIYLMYISLTLSLSVPFFPSRLPSLSLCGYINIYVHRNCAWIKWKVALNAHAPKHSHLYTHTCARIHTWASTLACTHMSAYDKLSFKYLRCKWEWQIMSFPYSSFPGPSHIPTRICVWCGTV